MAKTIGKREIPVHEFISTSLYFEYTLREITLVKVHLVRILIDATIFIIKCERQYWIVRNSWLVKFTHN